MRFERSEDSPVGKKKKWRWRVSAQTEEGKLPGVYEQSLCPAAGNLGRLPAKVT